MLGNCFNSLRPRQNGRLFADDTFKRIFLNENIRISTKNSLKFVPKGLINNIPALVLIMAWRRPGDKPLSEPMLVRSLTHICVTRPQWVKSEGDPRNLWILKVKGQRDRMTHPLMNSNLMRGGVTAMNFLSNSTWGLFWPKDESIKDFMYLQYHGAARCRFNAVIFSQ